MVTQREARDGDAARVANGLGWFSIGLGLAEVVAPGKMQKLIGLQERRSKMVRAYGLREIAAGVGILSNPRAAAWMWSRVAGDVADLASLGAGFAARGSNKARLAAATAAVAGVTALDILCSRQLSRAECVRAARSIFVQRAVEEVYGFWRDFSNFPRFMTRIESVRAIGDRRSHWIMKPIAGKTFEWDA